MRPNRRTQCMGNDLTPQAEPDRWDIAVNALLGPTDFTFQPGITVGVPVFFILRFATTIDYSDGNRVVGLIRMSTKAWSGASAIVRRISTCPALRPAPGGGGAPAAGARPLRPAARTRAPRRRRTPPRRGGPRTSRPRSTSYSSPRAAARASATDPDARLRAGANRELLHRQYRAAETFLRTLSVRRILDHA